MINLETIKSLYDDKPTLMRWLRKVEEALKNASLSSLQAVPVEGGKIKFVASFADGSTLESAATAMPSDFQSQITAPSIAIEGEATADTMRADLIESYGDVRSAGLRVSGTANLNDVNVTGLVSGIASFDGEVPVNSGQYRYITADNMPRNTGIYKLMLGDIVLGILVANVGSGGGDTYTAFVGAQIFNINFYPSQPITNFEFRNNIVAGHLYLHHVTFAGGNADLLSKSSENFSSSYHGEIKNIIPLRCEYAGYEVFAFMGNSAKKYIDRAIAFNLKSGIGSKLQWALVTPPVGTLDTSTNTINFGYPSIGTFTDIQSDSMELYI